MTRRAITRRLLGLLRPLAPLMAVSITCRVVNQTLGIAIPTIAAVGVVRIATGTASSAWTMVGLLIGIAVVKGSFRYLEQYTGHAVAFQLLATLRSDTYRHIEPLAPAGLEDERSGDLVARVVGDVDRVEPFFAHTIAPVVGSIVVPLLAIIGLAIFADPVLALALVGWPLLIVAVSPWLWAKRVAALSTELRVDSGEAAAALTDAVQGSREIAVLRAVPLITRRIDDRSAASAVIRRRLSRVAAARSALGELLTAGAIVTTAAVGIARIETGAIDLAAFAAAIAVAWAINTPGRALEEIVPDLEQALASAGRLFELSDRVSPVTDPDDSVELPADGSIRIIAVTVVLGESRTAVLDGVDITIPDRTMVAIVGPSGSGKSTLAELLVRFRDPERGRIEIGGTDVRRVPLADLRSRVTLVSQRPELFFGTVADNLRLASPDASDDDLMQAIERSALGAWVRSLPRGLDTPIGELGDTLSGGQRQRLALARGLLRDSSILILDEATSELDAEAGRRILQTVTEERERRTVVVVAHRLETVTDADLILVLDRGRLVETGRHQDLITAGGVYAGLWGRFLDIIEE